MAPFTREQLAEREKEINDLVAQDEREKAGEKLFALITDCAQGGDISNANRLRDMLYEVDPMALTSIIKANEIIDEAMSGAISDDFTKAWLSLQELLTEEEFMALYHGLEQHTVDAGKVVVKAGSKLDALFLVNRGNLRVVCNCAGKNVEVKTLEPGTMIGDNCFQPSQWTVSLATITPAELGILRQKSFSALMEKYPGLENKLAGYYRQFADIPEQLLEKDLKRRRHDRFKVDHRLAFQLIGNDGEVAERVFRGELDNISQGGLAFLMRIVKRENRWQLFGRNLLVTVAAEDGKLQFKGTVVALSVHDLQNHDYAVHLAFDREIGEDYFKPLVPQQPIEEEVPPEDTEEGVPGAEQVPQEDPPAGEGE